MTFRCRIVLRYAEGVNTRGDSLGTYGGFHMKVYGNKNDFNTEGTENTEGVELKYRASMDFFGLTSRLIAFLFSQFPFSW